MDSMSRVTTLYGSMNLNNQGLRLATFKVEPPFRKITASTSGRRLNASHIPAAANERTHPELGGFTETASEFPEGTILLLQANRSRRGSIAGQAAMFLRLRNTAPLIRITMRIPHDSTTRLGDRIAVFNGRADVLTAGEVRVLGLELNRKYVKAYMDEEEVEELYAITTLSEATGPRPQLAMVATTNGVDVREVSVPPTRRIRLRGAE